MKIENILSNFVYKTKCMLIRHDVIDMDTVPSHRPTFSFLAPIQDLDTAPLLFEEHLYSVQAVDRNGFVPFYSV